MPSAYTHNMKKGLLLITVITAVLISCKDDNKSAIFGQADHDTQARMKDTANYTTIKWADSTKDFGSVIFGEKVKIVFNFINSGNKPLYISNVRPGCGCTLADYTKSAVLPGQQGQVVAEYDSNHGAPGQTIHKTVSVTCNAKNQSTSILTFSGLIKPKPKA